MKRISSFLPNAIEKELVEKFVVGRKKNPELTTYTDLLAYATMNFVRGNTCERKAGERSIRSLLKHRKVRDNIIGYTLLFLEEENFRSTAMFLKNLKPHHEVGQMLDQFCIEVPCQKN